MAVMMSASINEKYISTISENLEFFREGYQVYLVIVRLCRLDGLVQDRQLSYEDTDSSLHRISALKRLSSSSVDTYMRMPISDIDITNEDSYNVITYLCELST